MLVLAQESPETQTAGAQNAQGKESSAPPSPSPKAAGSRHGPASWHDGQMQMGLHRGQGKPAAVVLLLQLTTIRPLSGPQGRGLTALCYLLTHQMFCRAHLETRMFKCPRRPYPSASHPTAYTALLETSVASAGREHPLLLPALLLLHRDSVLLMQRRAQLSLLHPRSILRDVVHQGIRQLMAPHAGAGQVTWLP